MIRRSLSILLFFISFTSTGEGFLVFKEGNFYGLKDESGEVLVPAIYEQLGWSNNEMSVQNGVIGFRKDSLWGLISIKNKIIVENSYFSILPFNDKLIKASVKGKFSNHLFYGLIDAKGTVKVSFNYAGLESLGKNIVASEIGETSIRAGFISLENVIIIPFEFQKIFNDHNWTIAESFDERKTLFTEKGEILVNGIDSILHTEKGLVVFRSGLAGFITNLGSIAHELQYKNFTLNKGSVNPINFPTWEIFDGKTLKHKWKCDSITFQNGIWITYLNGAQHLAFENNEDAKMYELMGMSNKHLIVRHSKTSRWSVIDRSGELLIEGFDQIKSENNCYYTKSEDSWSIYNKYGSKISRQPFQEVTQGADNHFIAKSNDYFGVLDFYGRTYLDFKYDSIKLCTTSFYAAKFLGKWGIMSRHGNWKAQPDFEEINAYGEIIVGKKGLAYSYYYKGEFLMKSTDKVEYVAGQYPVIKNEEGKYGLVNPNYLQYASSEFDTISFSQSHYQYKKDNYYALIDLEGNKSISFDLEFDDFGMKQEGFMPAKKSGRWGFLDDQNRMIIANRYENAKPFSEGLAAIKLKEKWGFIDPKETLIIQPFYDEIEPFINGRSIFKLNASFGIMDINGKEVLSGWKKIKRLSTGNFLVTDDEGKVGLTNAAGNFILRPFYESLKDLDGQVIIKKEGLMKLLDYNGTQVLKSSYSEIRKIGRFLLARK